MKRCCENCEHWERDDDPRTTGLCVYPEPPVPFYMVPDATCGPRTCDNDGGNCQVFEARL